MKEVSQDFIAARNRFITKNRDIIDNGGVLGEISMNSLNNSKSFQGGMKLQSHDNMFTVRVADGRSKSTPRVVSGALVDTSSCKNPVECDRNSSNPDHTILNSPRSSNTNQIIDKPTKPTPRSAPTSPVPGMKLRNIGDLKLVVDSPKSVTSNKSSNTIKLNVELWESLNASSKIKPDNHKVSKPWPLPSQRNNIHEQKTSEDESLAVNKANQSFQDPLSSTSRETGAPSIITFKSPKTLLVDECKSPLKEASNVLRRTLPDWDEMKLSSKNHDRNKNVHGDIHRTESKELLKRDTVSKPTFDSEPRPSTAIMSNSQPSNKKEKVAMQNNVMNATDPARKVAPNGDVNEHREMVINIVPVTASVSATSHEVAIQGDATSNLNTLSNKTLTVTESMTHELIVHNPSVQSNPTPLDNIKTGMHLKADPWDTTIGTNKLEYCSRTSNIDLLMDTTELASAEKTIFPSAQSNNEPNTFLTGSTKRNTVSLPEWGVITQVAKQKVNVDKTVHVPINNLSGSDDKVHSVTILSSTDSTTTEPNVSKLMGPSFDLEDDFQAFSRTDPNDVASAEMLLSLPHVSTKQPNAAKLVIPSFDFEDKFQAFDPANVFLNRTPTRRTENVSSLFDDVRFFQPSPILPKPKEKNDFNNVTEMKDPVVDTEKLLQEIRMLRHALMVSEVRREAAENKSPPNDEKKITKSDFSVSRHCNFESCESDCLDNSILNISHSSNMSYGAPTLNDTSFSSSSDSEQVISRRGRKKMGELLTRQNRKGSENGLQLGTPRRRNFFNIFFRCR